VGEAGRLCALAETGAILAGPAVHLLAGTRAGHTLRSQGPTSLPGLPEPIEVFAVEWQPREDDPLRIVLADDALVAT
jgi:class 3 adenylate cyclase